MKKIFLLVPMCALMFSCEKEELNNAVVENSEQAVLSTVERIEPNHPIQNNGDDRDSPYYQLLECPMSESEKEEGYTSWSGNKCEQGDCGECYNDANTRCTSSGVAFNEAIANYFTPAEAEIFWSKTYDEQFVLDNWDFFMRAYDLEVLKHPDVIIQLNFR